MNMNTKICNTCGQQIHASIKGMCKVCYNKQYYNAHRTHQPFYENKSCPQFLGCHIAERILSNVFKDVKRMSVTHHGYDFICNHGKKIDVKSACILNNKGNLTQWGFHINQNRIADFFLCIAFDTRTNLNPMHIWLLPNNLVNNKMIASVTSSTVGKWDAYKLDMSKTLECCAEIKSSAANQMFRGGEP